MSDFIDAHQRQILINAFNHAYLVVLAVLFATLIGVALAVVITRYRALEPLANFVSTVGLTIPAFALVGLLLPVFGLGAPTALILVTFYATLPILRNAIVGLTGVDGNLIESARGMGMSEATSMLKVRLPLAWPVILTGIRISMQMSMGIAAIAAYVLGPGLGGFIFTGLASLGRSDRALLHSGRRDRRRGRRVDPRPGTQSAGLRHHLEGNPGLMSDTTSSSEVSGAEIRLENVTKSYPGTKAAAVGELSLTIPAGEIVMFVGPSGCGKTTSLKMINRLIEPTSGVISIAGEDVRQQSADELRRRVGYVIQGGSLFPHMTVAKNIALVPKMLGWDDGRITKRTDELLDLVSLDPARYRDRYPRELSGGQQQRVGVARGLAADPPVILMDEPFGAVDPITRQRLQDELLSIQRELHKTIVCVTHDIDEAIKLGDRILILQEGAQIAQYDVPEVVLASPANEFVADFVGAGSALKQLSLSRITEVELRSPTTAKIGERTAEVKARAEANGDRAVVVLDDRDRPRGWPWLRQLKGDTVFEPVGELDNVDHRATLNDALDTMLTNSHGGAIITGDRDAFLGIADFTCVTDHMRSMQDKASAEAQRSAEAEAHQDPAERITAAGDDTEERPEPDREAAR